VKYAVDLKKLTDEQLNQLERLMTVGAAPEPGERR
jgi:hypothetical protein